MKKILQMILLGACLSCSIQPLQTEQCSIELKASIERPDLIDPSTSICRCRAYEFTQEHVGQVGNVYRKPLNYCNLMTGFPSKQYPHVANFWEEVREEANKPKPKSERAMSK